MVEMAETICNCILCRRGFSREDKEGLWVRGHFICPSCEKKIVSLSRDDPDYEKYKWGLKKIWQRPGA